MCNESCCDTHKKPNFVLSEKRSEVRLINQDRLEIKQFVVDNCCITSGERCDYLVNIESKNTSILIELKGCDVEKAISQLETASGVLVECLLKNKYWIVSSTRCPLTSSQIQMQKLKALRKGFKLIVNNSPVQHVI